MRDGVDIPRLAAAPLLDEAGIEVDAGALWAEKPAIVVFVRHFGCMFCRAQAAALQEAEPAISSAGGHLAVVGNGAPRFIAELRRVTGFEGPVLTDPSREAYRACGFLRGVRSNVNLATARQALRTFGKGFRQGRTQGDPWQQGGAVAMAPGDRLLAVQRARYAGEEADIDRLVAALGG